MEAQNVNKLVDENKAYQEKCDYSATVDTNVSEGELKLLRDQLIAEKNDELEILGIQHFKKIASISASHTRQIANMQQQLD